MVIINVNIKELKSDYTITLHKVNKDVIGEIPIEMLTNLTRNIDDIDYIEISIPKKLSSIFTFKRYYNYNFQLFDEFKNERFLCLNDREYFVIKEIVNEDNKYKTIKAYSREVKLGKIDIEIEDLGISLIHEDVELDTYSLNKYMIQETGWSLGHIDDDVRYDISEDGTKTDKIRWQESVNTNWYEYLTTIVKEQFNCIVVFDSFDKKVNLYNIDSFGDNVGICLSYDNYIKSIQNTDDTQDIVTRLKLVGNEEMDIIGATATGYPYVENYSYFLENGEMSQGLEFAMIKYQEMLVLREPQWKSLVYEKNKFEIDLIDKKNQLLIIYADINANERIRETYITNKDDINAAKIAAELTRLNDEKAILEGQIKTLEEDIINLKNAILDINKLCQRETATDENGILIFNDELLDELKEFLYYETYSNDSFLYVEDLISAGNRELSFKCVPTVDISIDVVDFMNRIVTNRFRKHWTGTLSLGDVVILYDSDNDKETFMYLVGFVQNFDGKSLSITLSNKKTKIDNTKTIGDLLNSAKKSMSMLSNKRYLFVKQKYNRINLPKSMIEREKVE